jgi:hypothetical protein
MAAQPASLAGEAAGDSEVGSEVQRERFETDEDADDELRYGSWNKRRGLCATALRNKVRSSRALLRPPPPPMCACR